MKHKLPIKAVCVIVLLVVLFYAGFRVAAALGGDTSVSFGLWSSDETELVQNFVVAGVDEDGTRTDLILLCQYSFSDNSLEVLQIPRDTKVENSRADKKINSAYGTSGKTETLFDEIQGITGIRPEKYVIVTFEGFRRLIDSIGGVEADVPMRMYYTDPVQNLVIDLYPGRQVLDGKKAEMFMRFRQNNDGTGYPEGDVGRIKAQKAFYEAAIEKLLSKKSLWNAPEILATLINNVSTDFSADEIVKYVKQLPYFGTEKVRMYSLPGEGGYDENGISYFFCEPEKIKALMKEHFGVN